MNYVRLDDGLTIFGLVVSDLPQRSRASRKRLRSDLDQHVRKRDLERAVTTIRSVDAGMVADLERDRDAHLAAALAAPEAVAHFTEELRAELRDTVGQSHDFMQLVKNVRGYAEELLRERRPDADVIDSAEALPNEGAIYFSTELMLMKLNALLYINEPNLAFGGQSNFSIHKFLTKYYRIYAWQARQKELDFRISGSCYEQVRYRAEAIGTVIQGLLDNLVKYAPPGSKADIVFEVNGSTVKITFQSIGPRIEPHEIPKIFTPGYRAAAARSIESGGQGIGLASAKMVSDALGLDLSCRQEPTEAEGYVGRYRTTFTIELQAVEGLF